MTEQDQHPRRGGAGPQANALRVEFVPGSLDRRDRLRRAVILCQNFTRNIAFYRAGWAPSALPLLHPKHDHAAFWRQTNGNFLDICVLEWCKLLGDKKAKHHWTKLVFDPVSFEAAMYKHIGIDADAFALKVQEIRRYRDTFVAHLDSDLVAHIPLLDGPAETALRFYHEHLVTNEARAGYLVGLTGASDELVRGYDQCLAEATAVFRHRGQATS